MLVCGVSMIYNHDKESFYKYLYHHCGCANAGQSPQERRCKYALAKYFGKSVYDARIYRDWNREPFARKFGFSSWKTMLKLLNMEV